MNVGIIGAGLIGHKRAQSIKKAKKDRIVAVADIDLKKAQELASTYSCKAYSDWQKLLKLEKLDVVIIAVPNQFIKPIALSALRSGAHILCEKPFGRNSKESQEILNTAKKFKRMIKVGFNHRFHPAILKAKGILDTESIGQILFIRGHYGHGGRLGMEKEWRTNKEICGGGELLDQGVHLIDLCRYFSGDFKEVFGIVSTSFWNIDVEDNAYITMRNDRVVAQLHASWTNWKNIFSFEIYGSNGFLQIEGLGGSYGKEKLIFGKRKKEFGVPIVKEYLFEKDNSWQEEWKNFRNSILGKESMIGDGNDGLAANKIIDKIYKSSAAKKVLKI